MTRAATYTVVSLDLTVAGKETVDGPWGVCRFLDAIDSAGDIATTAKVTVRAEREAEPAPLRLGQGFLARNTRRFVIEWLAQSGIVIELGFAERPEDLDWDADPPAKLLTGGVKLKGHSNIPSTADVSIAATTTDPVLAANTSRVEAIITNLAVNAQTMRIGDSNAGAARGIELAPGQTIVLTTTAAISAYNPGASAESLAVLEVTD